MRVLGRGALLVAVAAVCARGATADDSVFGIRGLGLLGRPISARAAGAAGAFALFDPGSALNPAALSRWQTMVGWVVGVPSSRHFTDANGSSSLSSTRFPLIGFATSPGPRMNVGVTIGDYIDRTWGVTTKDSVTLRGSPDSVTDVKQSLGGISDLQLAGSYQLSDRVALGIGLHALTGSARSSVSRQFSDSSYATFLDLSQTDFSGRGVSFGVTAQVLPKLVLAGTLRFNSNLTAHKSTGQRAKVGLPTEIGLAAQVFPAPGIAIGANVQYAGWSAASAGLAAVGDTARNVWSYAVGGEFDTFRRGNSRVPLRLGFRSRQLPFVIQGSLIRETAASGGFALDFAGAHTTMDVGFERGSRSVAGLKETFTTGYVGVTIRP